MNDSDAPVTQFGAPDAPYCDPATACVTIIPAPLEYSVCYMQGTQRGPQAILNASSQMELYDEELDCCPIEIGVYTRPLLNYSGMDHAAALKATGEAVREVLKRDQFPFTIGGEHSLSAPPIAVVHEYFPDLSVVHIDAHGDLRNEYEGTPLSHASIEFESNTTTMPPRARATLDQLIALLRRAPHTAIEIGGHTDKYGEPGYNLQLSRRRAEVVRDYFISHGLTNQFTAVGYGASRPLPGAETQAGFQHNRRIELRVKGVGDL